MDDWDDLDAYERQRAHLSLDAWERLFGGDRLVESRQMIEVDGKVYVVGLPHDSNEDVIYLPDKFYHKDDNISAQVHSVSRSEIPDATAITFRVDAGFHDVDYKEALESELSARAVLALGDSLEIAGFSLEVVGLEPAAGPRVFCDGEEVAIHFEAPAGIWRGQVAAGWTCGSMFEEDDDAGAHGWQPFSGNGQKLGEF